MATLLTAIVTVVVRSWFKLVSSYNKNLEDNKEFFKYYLYC